MKKFLLSFKYAIQGIITTIIEERNIKIHLLAAVVTIIMGIKYQISIIEWIICILLFGLVISSEIINTSIENAVDLITNEKNELAKKAKDAAARCSSRKCNYCCYNCRIYMDSKNFLK